MRKKGYDPEEYEVAEGEREVKSMKYMMNQGMEQKRDKLPEVEKTIKINVV